MTGRRVAVIGLGLIGASLAGALRDKGDMVRGMDVDPDARHVAVQRDLVDEVAADVAAAVYDATLVILAIPVLSIVQLLPEIDALSPSEAVIMDVGSVKAPVIGAMELLPGASRAVGGHPIAGKEVAGAAAADTALFRGRTFALVPNDTTSGAALRTARTVVRDVGALPMVLSAGEHDRIVARTSHLPQLLSMSLALSLEMGDETLAGPGLRDMTRLAASGPSIWNDIFLSNADNIQAALERCVSHLENLTRMAQAKDSAALKHAMLRANRHATGISEAVPS